MSIADEERHDTGGDGKPEARVPDGGTSAWLTVFGCFLAFFASFGFVTSFGIFQAYYEKTWPERNSSDISWIGSLQLWSITGMAIPSVILNAHVGPQWTLALGTFFTVFGVMMASLSTRYYQVLLSHGVVASLGIGLTFMPIIGLPNQWFGKKRGLAVGLAIGGSSVGGVIWPVMVDHLINKHNISYAWTMRAIGFTQLASMTVAIACIRTNTPRNTAVKLSSFPIGSALRRRPVLVMAGGLILHFLGIYVPYFYAPLYGQCLGAGPETAFQLSAVLNASTFFGRFVMGSISDKAGHCNTLMLCVAISAVLAFAWQAVSTVPGMFAWVVFYGWFSGASVSLQSPAIIPLVPAPKLTLMGPYIAILCQISSFGSLAGNPIAGALLHKSSTASSTVDTAFHVEDFHTMMWFTGAVLFGAAIFYQAARYMHTPNMCKRA